MSAETSAYARSQDPSLTFALKALGPESYTVHRLQHATADHLHLTTRRCFVGPIPEGWLKSHRKEWYKHYLHINRSSKAPSFSADSNTSRQRRITGLDGPSAAALFRPSFPQPDDAEDADDADNSNEEARADVDGEEEGAEEDDGDADTIQELEAEDEDSDAAATITSPPALSIPRGQSNPDDPSLIRENFSDVDQALSSYNTAFSTNNGLRSPNESHASGDTSTPQLKRRKTSTTSFVTASDGSNRGLQELESSPALDDGDPGAGPEIEQSNMQPVQAHDSTAAANTPQAMSPSLNTTGANSSNTSLLRSQHVQQRSDIINVVSSSAHAVDQVPQDGEHQPPSGQGVIATKNEAPHGLVRFNIPDPQPLKQELQVRAKLAQHARKRIPRRFTRGKLRDGEIVKVEKMLVRLDVCSGSEQPSEEYDEKDSLRVETRTVEKWREFMVVCRESHEDDALLCLQMYKTRVIPATNESETKKRPAHQILLSPAHARVNLYSALDKTVVLWKPKDFRTPISFLRPRSSASAVEWYSFLRGVLGQHRARTLQINIPDLSVSLRLDNPFELLESSTQISQAAEGNEEAMAQAVKEEQAIAGKIIDRCMAMLFQSKEWGDVLKEWNTNNRIGLAWKRYDRLEWVHGANERKMYGTIALQRTHDLELRPKQHYPQSITTPSGDSMTEPPPVEGFLIRLTSQKGSDQKFGKLFYKRLYFATHNQHLLFLRPAKAAPPPPPKMPMTENSKIPSTKQIAGKIPLIYAVNPFPVHENKVAWLSQSDSNPADLQRHDLDALDEADRNVHMLLNCDGFIDLCDVVKVRKVQRGAVPADEVVDEGSDVDFDIEVTDSHNDDGTTKEMDDDRTFELLMRNGLVVRLQAFSKATKKEWMKRLRALSKYWLRRTAHDLELFKSVRRQNLSALNIDERAEGFVGSFARKWEVTKSFASPELYNMCGISSCRTIHRSGILFRKPRIHRTFSRCRVILCHGHLVIFEDTLRKSTGKKLEHIHHERIASIDLKDCYLYSGLITEDDLLYQNQTFDSNMPSNHALPRMYLEDGWTSTDEDAMTCFVIWHGQKKGWFRGSKEVDDVKDDQKSKSKGQQNRGKTLKRVSQLGVTGRSIVFRARSRAERDHWVLGIETEIERLAQSEEVRVVGEDK
ncbi:hypothetical protein MBLNU459_g5091t1 [Dothideomycetes sp. NU459]